MYSRPSVAYHVCILVLAVTCAIWNRGHQSKWFEWTVREAHLRSYTLEQRPVGQQHNSGIVDAVFIVRFNEYSMAEEHRSYLHEVLDERRWEWIERDNVAMKYPTDFALVRASGSSLDDVKSAFERLRLVRDVHPERMVRRDIKQISEEPPEQKVEKYSSIYSFQPCTSQQSEGEGSLSPLCIRKRPGRLSTRLSFGLEVEDYESQFRDDGELFGNNVPGNSSTRHFQELISLDPGDSRSLHQLQSLPQVLGATDVWVAGFTGRGVKVGVFDTGIKKDHPDVQNIEEQTNWTHELTVEDGLGHGSFVAGVIAGTASGCPGLAPDVLLHTFRVFTNDQVSFTSWFLDAFNYAIATRMDVVNLSIGGPDYLDDPFVDKVREVTGAGIVMVSAIGNDGPLYGTLNNPADQNDVIGVGGIDWKAALASFSSRGMTTWELPIGYGRVKPDVVAPGKDVKGSRITGGCRSLSGTSVASPVVAGAAALLMSTLEPARRHIVNPASMKQILVEGATQIDGCHMYEQGQGKLDVAASFRVLQEYSPKASILPSTLNLTACPYAWPHCRQPLYANAMPLIFNATILNALGVVGELEAPPIWIPVDEGGQLLDVRFEWSETLWPWSGNLAVYLRVKPQGSAFTGMANGNVSFTVVSPPDLGESTPRRSSVLWPVTASIIPTPDRSKRILWDQFHSLRYPPAYIPRDDLSVRHDILDWHGDHPHTNFHGMYDALRDKGYFLEVLASPFTCFNASQYGSLMIVDTEDEFYAEEIAKLETDVKEYGLGLVIFADWYAIDTIKKIRFYDDNTRSWWNAVTGGANVPALNDLLSPFGMAFAGGTGDHALDLSSAGLAPVRMASGSSLAAFPSGGYLFYAPEQGRKDLKKGLLREAASRSTDTESGTHGPPSEDVIDGSSGIPILGLAGIGHGHVAVYGDSNCLDSNHQKNDCYDMLFELLQYASEGTSKLAISSAKIDRPLRLLNEDLLPKRRNDIDFTEVSFVLQNAAMCYPNSPLEYQGLSYGSDLAVSHEEGVVDTALDAIGNDSDSYEAPIDSIPAEYDGPISRKDFHNDGLFTLRKSNGMRNENLGNRNRFSIPSLTVIQLSQLFSLLGGAGLVTLWSLARRRRQSDGQTDGSASTNGIRNHKTHLLPIFIQDKDDS